MSAKTPGNGAKPADRLNPDLTTFLDGCGWRLHKPLELMLEQMQFIAERRMDDRNEIPVVTV